MKNFFTCLFAGAFICISGLTVAGSEKKIVILVNKIGANAAETIPQRGGSVTYQPVSERLEIKLKSYGLDFAQTYQLTLNGPGEAGTGNLTDDHLARTAYNTGNIFAGGCLSLNGFNVVPDPGGDTPCTDCSDAGTCLPEGFYNYELALSPSMHGDLGSRNKIELPVGYYLGVKFLVKENLSPFPSVLFEQEPLNFLIKP